MARKGSRRRGQPKRTVEHVIELESRAIINLKALERPPPQVATPAYMKWVRIIFTHASVTLDAITYLNIFTADAGDYGLSASSTAPNPRGYIAARVHAARVFGPVSSSEGNLDMVIGVYGYNVIAGNPYAEILSSNTGLGQTTNRPSLRWRYGKIAANPLGYPPNLASKGFIDIFASSPKGDYIIDVLMQFR